MTSAEKVRSGPCGLVVAAPASGTGKTVATVGLIEALRRRGRAVAAAKSGPDFIDPQFLAAAAQGDCINLDPWAMPPERLRARAAAHGGGSDVLVIEGVMGLFDSAAGGGGSTADLAEALGLPVILIVDAGRQAQSIAALVHGFATFRRSVDVAGIIATRIASDRHESMIRSALDAVDIDYLGSIRASEQLAIPSRHLGLVQAGENEHLAEIVASAGDAVGGAIDLDRLLAHARRLPVAGQARPVLPLGQRISIAHDAAFSFLYPHLVADWRKAGAQIDFFSPLRNEPPSSDCDAVYLPGGYPELHAGTIAEAEDFCRGIANAVARGALIYGECGGYMVLGEALVDGDGNRHRMLGVLGHVTSFHERKRQLGYRMLEAIADWPLSRHLRGHEFHYSTLAAPGEDAGLFRAWDSEGHGLGIVGGRRGSVMGSYIHIIDASE